MAAHNEQMNDQTNKQTHRQTCVHVHAAYKGHTVKKDDVFQRKALILVRIYDFNSAFCGDRTQFSLLFFLSCYLIVVCYWFCVIAYLFLFCFTFLPFSFFFFCSFTRSQNFGSVATVQVDNTGEKRLVNRDPLKRHAHVLTIHREREVPTLHVKSDPHKVSVLCVAS